jgi:hypothetical protein
MDTQSPHNRFPPLTAFGWAIAKSFSMAKQQINLITLNFGDAGKNLAMQHLMAKRGTFTHNKASRQNKFPGKSNR